MVVALVASAALAGCSGLPGMTKTSFTAIAEEAPAPAPLPFFDTDENTAPSAPASVMSYAETVGPSEDLESLMAYYAGVYEIPLSLVRHVADRESDFNPSARNGKYWGLMQISPATARSMGYKGTSEGLLDPDTNLRYAVKYLAGAYIVAQGDEKRADWLYRTGYYYEAKRLGLLEEAGLR